MYKVYKKYRHVDIKLIKVEQFFNLFLKLLLEFYYISFQFICNVNYMLFEIVFVINPLVNVYYFEKTRDFYYSLCSIIFRLMN